MFVPLIQKMKFSAMFLRHLIQWPSVDILVKFYGDDRPRGTYPSVELKTRRAEYSDFGPIERFILVTVLTLTKNLAPITMVHITGLHQIKTGFLF